MSLYRRLYVPGGTYFFTVCLAQRGSDLLIRHADRLRHSFRVTMQHRPFHIDAIVIMPDHLHTVWTLPAGDADFSVRWGAIKSRFTREMRRVGFNPTLPISDSKARQGDAGIWQRRFWEHYIRDEEDYNTHVAYCWNNPVKHGLAAMPQDWQWSSVHRDMVHQQANKSMSRG